MEGVKGDGPALSAPKAAGSVASVPDLTSGSMGQIIRELGVYTAGGVGRGR
jgi:hypothetical protein